MRFLFAFLLLIVSPAQAEFAPSWDVIAEKSEIVFQAKQMAAPFEGRFEDFTADIVFDPDNPQLGHVRVEIDILSVNTQNDERDENIKGPSWFDTSQFPKAVFETTEIHHVEDNQYEAKATLTIRGASQAVTLPFELKIISDKVLGLRAIMDAEITLNRLDFGLGTGDWEGNDVVSHDVKVSIHLEAVQRN